MLVPQLLFHEIPDVLFFLIYELAHPCKKIARLERELGRLDIGLQFHLYGSAGPRTEEAGARCLMLEAAEGRGQMPTMTPYADHVSTLDRIVDQSDVFLSRL